MTKRMAKAEHPRPAELEDADEPTEESASQEIARILKQTASKILATEDCDGKLLDVNGNSVGRYRLER